MKKQILEETIRKTLIEYRLEQIQQEGILDSFRGEKWWDKKRKQLANQEQSDLESDVHQKHDVAPMVGDNEEETQRRLNQYHTMKSLHPKIQTLLNNPKTQKAALKHLQSKYNVFPSQEKNGVWIAEDPATKKVGGVAAHRMEKEGWVPVSKEQQKDLEAGGRMSRKIQQHYKSIGMALQKENGVWYVHDQSEINKKFPGRNKHITSRRISQLGRRRMEEQKFFNLIKEIINKII